MLAGLFVFEDDFLSRSQSKDKFIRRHY